MTYLQALQSTNTRSTASVLIGLGFILSILIIAWLVSIFVRK